MRIFKVKKLDVANGPGIRTSIFVSGCNIKCKGCFNEEAQDFNSGTDYRGTIDILDYYLDNKIISGLTILGGEPFDQDLEELLHLVKEIKKYKDDIWIFSGYTFENIISDPKKVKILEECDVLVDGPFMEEHKKAGLTFRGSDNQRLINLTRSLKEQKAILYDR